MFYIDYKIALFTTNLHNGLGVLAAKLANKKKKASGDGGFTVLLQQPLSQCAWRRW